MKIKKVVLSLMLAIICVCIPIIKPCHAHGFVKWVDFNANYDTLQALHLLDKKYRQKGVNGYDFVKALAYVSIKNGNKFNYSADRKHIQAIATAVESGKNPFETYENNKYYNYYVDCYTAIFSEFFGENESGNYGIKAYFPLAKGYWYNHYDDFGNSRSYGFKRKHLGHDLMGGIGTPVVAVEGGTVQELGWNMYGGWRIGIRSFDQKRYYYYAHLRRDTPFAVGINQGCEVKGGDIIGYLGNTGYSNTPNTNLTTGNPHLHFGMQLIFDKSQEDGNGEIWIDVYNLCKFLNSHKASAKK